MTVRTITLDGDAAVARLMARAVATARGRSGGLPETEVVQRGVRTDLDHLARYAHVCGFAVSDVLPATYVHVRTFALQLTLMAEPDFPLALPGLVHVANRVQLLRAVRADETLDLTVRAEGLRAHPRGRQVDLVGEAHVGEELVWQGRSTYLARGTSSGARDAEQRRLEVAVDLDAPATARWRLPADLGRRYAAVSGDVNPIHLNPLAAKAFGFPRAIAHGMWTMARCLAALQPRLPDAYTADVEFRRPVLLPSTVELRTAPADGGWDVVVASHGHEHLRGTVR